VNAQDLLFEVETELCGTVILTPVRWQHIVEHHPEMESRVEKVRATLLDPNLIYETPYHETRAYYARGLIDDPPYKGCYVAVFVRYALERPSVWTAYLPSHLSQNPGTLLFAKK
jgi:hypothetical protein